MAHYDPLHPAPNPSVQTFDQASFNPEVQPLRSHPSQNAGDDFVNGQQGLPPGAAPPRFYQLADDGPLRNPAPLGNYGEPQPRDSIVSYGTGSPYNRESAYAPPTPGASTTFLGGAAPGSYHDDPYSSTARFETNMPMSPMGGSRQLEKEEQYEAPAKKKGSSLMRWGVGVLIALLIAIAVLIPVYFKFLRPGQLAAESGSTGSGGGSGGGGSSGGGGGGGGGSTQVPITGGDGSTVTLTDGGTMTYVNKFGGYWVDDPSNPFDNSARAQSWTKPLNESWDYSTDKIYGVNLGGWLNTEPFISPALYEKYNVGGQTLAIDEWTLSELMANDTEGGGLQKLMEDHYKTFITEEDFAAIAAAGLSWVRIPLPYWAIEVWPGEPFLPKVSWTYFLKAIKWARKYGLRINLDLHAVPGSQNSWNHSGRIGHGPNFMNGVMGIANAQRTLDYIRILTEFISQPQYRDVIPFFGIINEALVGGIGQDKIGAFYLEAYNMIRDITGTGEGNGPLISIHDGFIGIDKWAGFLAGADRLGLDTHPYLAFGGVGNDPMDQQILKPCLAWASNMNNSMNSGMGFTAAGEWSNAINDCGLFVNGVGLGTRYEGTFTGFSGQGAGDCSDWTNYKSWTNATREGIKQFNLASMDALQNWFFWTWNIGESRASGSIESPFWSYKLGLAEGWITKDPREAAGTCLAQGLTSNPFTPPLKAWQTGGAGAGSISAAQSALYGVWPPATISGASPPYATYTQTGTMSTMPVPTYTSVSGKTTKTFDAGSGWFKTADGAQAAFTPVSGCTYAPAWDAIATPDPMTCANARRWPIARPTPRP